VGGIGNVVLGGPVFEDAFAGRFRDVLAGRSLLLHALKHTSAPRRNGSNTRSGIEVRRRFLGIVLQLFITS
jgi:hypothetical protein